MIEKFLVLNQAMFKADPITNVSEFRLMCLIANQVDKRNPESMIFKVAKLSEDQNDVTIIHKGTGIAYRKFDELKNYYKRYGSEIVLHPGAQDDVREVFAFHDIETQRDFFERYKDMIGSIQLVDCLEKLEMPFHSHVLQGAIPYTNFGEWA